LNLSNNQIRRSEYEEIKNETGAVIKYVREYHQKFTHPNLEYLILSNNQIEILDKICDMPKLKFLDLNNNKIL